MSDFTPAKQGNNSIPPTVIYLAANGSELTRLQVNLDGIVEEETWLTWGLHSHHGVFHDTVYKQICQ